MRPHRSGNHIRVRLVHSDASLFVHEGPVVRAEYRIGGRDRHPEVQHVSCRRRSVRRHVVLREPVHDRLHTVGRGRDEGIDLQNCNQCLILRDSTETNLGLGQVLPIVGAGLIADVH